MRLEREVHGVPLWLLREYLVELGGQAQGDDRVVGDGWEAHFARMEDFRIGSLAVGRAWLVIEGEDGAIERLTPLLEMKLMRGGG